MYLELRINFGAQTISFFYFDAKIQKNNQISKFLKGLLKNTPPILIWIYLVNIDYNQSSSLNCLPI